MKAYKSLEQHFDRIFHLGHAKAMISWDEATMMPMGGGLARGNSHATLDVLLHDMVTDPRVGDWIDAADTETLGDWQRANLREIRQLNLQSSCLPADLVEAQAKAKSLCEQTWRSARQNNDWHGLMPLLDEVVNLGKREAELRVSSNKSSSNLSLYDSLLDLYEPGMRSDLLSVEFDRLKAFLPDFLQEVIEVQSKSPALPLTGNFEEEKQRQLGLQMMGTLGFDFNRGRMDVSHHPFCGGVPDDVRITTRYNTENFLDSLMATLHETGHALYQQGLPTDWISQPVGDALSFATHESQSLLMEMQACRSREFVEHIAPQLQSLFAGNNAKAPEWQSENLYRHSVRVKPDFIRVDADEVTYPLHVILRFDIEKALINGDLSTAQIPEVWNEKMKEYLGISTEGNFTNGCLQDVHWPAGLLGYFPTYTLGAMTAAQLFRSAKDQIPGLMNQIREGDFSNLVAWLGKNIHQKGKKESFDELLQSATGSTLNVDFFIDHLKERYLSAAY